MSHKYENILDTLSNSYWYSTERQIETIRSVTQKISADKVLEMRQQFDKGDFTADTSDFIEVEGSTAIVRIHGVIMKRMNMMHQISGGTSTEMLTKAFGQLAESGNIDTVLLDVNSDGGSVKGVEIATRALRELRKKKRVIAVANDNMNSAAYYIASAANKIYVTPSSSIGSIGVISRLQNIKQALEDKGIEVHTFRAGEFKQVPNSVEKITEEGKQIVQEAVNKYYNDFVEAVRINRNISLEQARNMSDGKVHKGTDAIEAGLADGEATVDSVLEMISEEENLEDRLALAMGTIEAQSEQISDLAEENQNSKEAIKQMTEKLAEVETENKRNKAEAVVDAAIDSGKIAPAKRDRFVNMALENDLEMVREIFSAIPENKSIPLDDINESREEHSDDPFAPKNETEARVMSQFAPLRERYGLEKA